MAEELVVTAPSKKAKTFTLTIAYPVCDLITETWFRSGDVLESITPFLQNQIDGGVATVA